jgi:peptide/nickel transport system ATP-binding protein
MQAKLPILNVENLTVAYRQGKSWLEALRDVSLCIPAGEVLGLAGESGSGKTTLALAILGYLGRGGAIQAGKIELGGIDLCALDQAGMRQVWGRQVALVPQNPQSALNPSLPIGEQLAELLRYHQGLDALQARQKTLDWFARVHLADPPRVADSYPHQVSGGMLQRVLIAMALSSQPQLLILDEPTTSLDVTTQAVILDLVRELIVDSRTAALYITHNMGVVAQVCSRLAILYAGELVEQSATQDLLRRPLHPYTQGLLSSIPRPGETRTSQALQAIPGSIPGLGQRPAGCVFQPRCPKAIEICSTRPELFASGLERQVRCFRWQENIGSMFDAGQAPEPSQLRASTLRQPGLVLDVDRVEVHFPHGRSMGDRARRQPVKEVRAVDQVSLQIRPGQTLGVVGESGSGKTTLARAIMGLVEITGGEIRLLERPLPAALSARDLDTLRHLQMVFQNPEEALNPYQTVGESLSQPVEILLGKSRAAARQEVPGLLGSVGLPASFADRLPGQLSGGEIQRVALARAFASLPDLLIVDEPLSALDVSIQAAILNLMAELQSQHHTSLLFISHDLAVVAYLADEVAVIYLGYLMELSKAADLFKPPFHPYTEALLASIPSLDPTVGQKPIRLSGEIPSPLEIPSGCPFHTRCPRFLGDLCVRETPPWRTVPENGKRYFCHIPVENLRLLQASPLERG